MTLLSFPDEPGPGSKITLVTDGHANGMTYDRVEVQEALGPQATRRWRPTSIPGMSPRGVARTSYSTWTDVLANAAMGSHHACAIEVESGDESVSFQARVIAERDGIAYGVALQRAMKQRSQEGGRR